MPLAQLRQDYVPLPPTPAASRPMEGGKPGTSPALTLHQQLDRHAAEAAAPGVERWSARRSITFIVTAAAALWMAILMAAAETVHLIA